MDTRTYNINLRNDYFNPVAAGLSQYDEGVTLAFNVYDGTDPAEFAAGTTARIMGVRPSGVGFDVACTLTDNVATVSTITDMTGEAGIFPVEIRFYNSGVNVGTCNFIFAIERAAHPDGTIDADITHEQDIVDKINQILIQTTPDTTLTRAGVAADAKATGLAIDNVEEGLRVLGSSLWTFTRGLQDDQRKKAPAIYKEVSGNPVIVEDSAGYYARSAQMYAHTVEVDFDPVQDFNGYDYAWAGGNGKNKLNNTAVSRVVSGVTFTVNSDGSVTANGTSTANIFFDLGIIDTPGEYILSGCPSGGSNAGYSLRNASSTIRDYGGGATFTVTDGNPETICIVFGGGGGIVANNLTFKPMVRLASESDATYAPYENICPISGAESVTVKRTGKNMLDTNGMSTATQNGVTYSRNTNGAITIGGKATANTYRICGSFYAQKDIQYVLTGTPSGGGNGKYRMTVGGIGYDTGSGLTFTGDGLSHNTSVDIYPNYPESGTLTFYPMIRPASISDDTYEPYTGNQISAYLGGQYIGGEVDLISGDVTVMWKSYTFDGSSDESWTTDAYPEGTTVTWPLAHSIRVDGIDATKAPYCEDYRTQTGTIAESQWGTVSVEAPTYPAGSSYITVRPASIDQSDNWRSYLAANPLTVWVKVKDVVSTGAVDGQALEMLYKDNVLTTEKASIDLVYPADTKIYIDNAIAAAVASTLG